MKSHEYRELQPLKSVILTSQSVIESFWMQNNNKFLKTSNMICECEKNWNKLKMKLKIIWLFDYYLLC